MVLRRLPAGTVKYSVASARSGTAFDGPALRAPRLRHGHTVGQRLARIGAIVVILAATTPSRSFAQTFGQDAAPIKERNIGVSRTRATALPRSEGDQALVDGWPLYRTDRGQVAFNDAMAALQATDSAPPAAATFNGCPNLECNLSLPALDSEGWIPAGRYWVSSTDYVLIAHSPRQRNGQSYRRRGTMGMRYFVFHEFHNGSRNTDPYDTISSHRSSVFVPLYMGKQGTDAKGHRFVVVVQVAPVDVVSIHASNLGSAGAGLEVAKNVAESLEPLQGLAGALVATLVKSAMPNLKVVNHRGSEGQPMLQIYERRLAAARSRSGAAPLALPFVPAPASRIAVASVALGDLIVRRGVSPRIPVAQRGIMPSKAVATSPAPAAVPAAAPRSALSPLAAYLRVNLATMKRLPDYAHIFPSAVAAVAEESPEKGIVYLLDADRQILGHIQAQRVKGVIVGDRYVYASKDRGASGETTFALDLTQPMAMRQAALTQPGVAHPMPALVEPIRPAAPPTSATRN